MKCNLLIKKALSTLVGFFTFTFIACDSSNNRNLVSEIPLVHNILEDQSSIYYANYPDYNIDLKSLPIGMFDSGTGGLTVMEQFLAMDNFNNETGEEEPDGIPDFYGEDFIYLADQANMPYGVYSSQNKNDYLRELIIKDALFLTKEPNRTKFIVIACNTATAFGLEDVKTLLEMSRTGVKVIGVIDAGVDGSMKSVSKEEKSFAVGVLATVGTISSGGYQNSIKEYVDNNDFKGDIRIVSQGGLGFAEAVDSEPDYISTQAQQIRDSYRGPIYGSADGIKPELLPLYNFDNFDNELLIEREDDGSIIDIQLNSIENYARFHLITLMNKHKEENPGVKMKSVILGCTHYPYVYDTLVRVIEELREYKNDDGENPFAEQIDEKLFFVDPAVNTAKETFKQLFAANILNKKREGNEIKLNAYISVPHKDLPETFKDSTGKNLNFKFKYGRDMNSNIPSVSIVPFSKKNINSKNIARIQERLPLSYHLIHKSMNQQVIFE